MLPAWIIEEIRKEEAKEQLLELPLEMPYWEEYNEPVVETTEDRGVTIIEW